MEKVIQLLEFEKLTLNDLIKYEVADESDLQMIAEIDQALQLLQSRVIESVCINCGQERNKHSKATELCPDRFKHYEQIIL